MLLFYTFCCEIGRHTKSDLIRTLITLMNGDHHLKRDETGIIWYQKYLKSAF